jgi:1-acyl-sn-glycerol-3-phosphate acyltransferase
VKIEGKENIPEGAAIICANHSSLADPFYVALAYGNKYQLRIVAKAELFRIPIISTILKKLGMISVDRDVSDVKSVKTILRCLKKGEAVAIFPEGTRSKHDNEVPAKHGAIKLAERTNAPLVPVFIPRKKPLFRTIDIIVGEMYHIPEQKERRTLDDYNELADTLMEKISALKREKKAVT